MPNPLLCTGSMIFRFILGVCVEFAFDDCASNFDCFEVPVRQLFLKSPMAHEKGKMTGGGRGRERGPEEGQAASPRLAHEPFKIGVIVGRILDAERTGKINQFGRTWAATGNPCPSTHSLFDCQAHGGIFRRATTQPQKRELPTTRVADSRAIPPKDHRQLD